MLTNKGCRLRGVDPEIPLHVLHKHARAAALELCIALYMTTAPSAQAEQDCVLYSTQIVVVMGHQLGILTLQASVQVSLCWMMHIQMLCPQPELHNQ